MEKYMNEGLSFQQAHNKAEATGAPAFPNQNGKLGYILNQDLMNKPEFAGLGEAFHTSVLIGYPFFFATVAYFTKRAFIDKAGWNEIGPLGFMMLGANIGYLTGRQIDMAGEGKQVRVYRELFT